MHAFLHVQSTTNGLFILLPHRSVLFNHTHEMQRERIAWSFTSAPTFSSSSPALSTKHASNVRIAFSRFRIFHVAHTVATYPSSFSAIRRMQLCVTPCITSLPSVLDLYTFPALHVKHSRSRHSVFLLQTHSVLLLLRVALGIRCALQLPQEAVQHNVTNI